ncbi:MAG: DUF2282 domain-containing protein [Alphaproteobacteria bacterium]|nr:DUF2282 domain-containing protein [Alphaproteobacteria bacterium]
MKKTLVAAAVLAGLMAANLSHAEEMGGKSPEREKCYGVAKAGKNDCASKDGKNSCAGSAKKDADPNVWIYLPKGACDKIAGASKE